MNNSRLAKLTKEQIRWFDERQRYYYVLFDVDTSLFMKEEE